MKARKKVPPVRSRLPHRYTGNPCVPKCHPETKFPLDPPYQLYVKSMRSETQPRKKSSPAVHHPTVIQEIHAFPNPAPTKKQNPPRSAIPPLYKKSMCLQFQPRKKVPRHDRGSPTSCHVTSRHIMSRHIMSRHVTPIHATPRHVK